MLKCAIFNEEGIFQQESGAGGGVNEKILLHLQRKVFNLWLIHV